MAELYGTGGSAWAKSALKAHMESQGMVYEDPEGAPGGA